MDGFSGYNVGSGLISVNATSVTTETLTTDDVNSQSGIINFNTSSFSNVQNVYVHNNVISANITSLSNSHIALSNSHTSLSNSHMQLSNDYVSYSNTFLKVSGSNLYTLSNLCLGTSTNATQQLTLTGNIQVSNLYTSNLIVYRNSNVLDTDGKIDYNTWIKGGPIQDDGTGVIIIPIPVFTTINNNVNVNTGGNGDENYDASTQSNPIYVHWNSLIYKPVYNNINDERIGFGSNIYIENKSKIYGINKLELLKYDGGKYRRIASSLVSDDLWYDFNNKTMYLNTIYSSNINTSNIITSNINTSNLLSSNITTVQFASSNITSSNINASNISTATFNATNSFCSNLTASNVFSSNIVNFNLWTSNVSSSNVASCNYYGVNFYASNIMTSNFATSNMTSCNLSTNFITATNVAGQIGNFTDTIYALNNVFSSNVTSCNINALSNNYHGFSNMSWKFNDSNIYHGMNEKVIAIGKTNATEKLDVLGNIKSSGAFIGNLTVNSNLAGTTSMSVSGTSLFKNDGTIDTGLFSNINHLAGNSNSVNDNFDPTTRSSNIFVHENNLIWRDVYTDNNFNFGFSSNVFFNSNSKLCTTDPTWDYTKVGGGRIKTYNYPFVRSNVVIDFATLTANFSNLNCSNIANVISLRTSNFTTCNVTTPSIVASNANLSNLWASNVGINQINPLYNLDVNGGTRVQKDLLVNSNIICGCNLTVGSNVGIGINNPAYNLDVRGYGLQVLGGASTTTPTIIYLNSTGVGNTTGQLQFVNAGHSITCTDSNNYLGIANVGGGHNIYYSSGGHNFSGITRFNSSVYVPSTNFIEFGIGVAGKDANAGKVGYQTFTSGSLDIVGAGSTAGSRNIKLWDNVTIPNNLTLGTLQLGGSTVKGIFCGSYTFGSSGNNFLNVTVTHGWNLSGTQTILCQQASSGLSFIFQITAKNANSFDATVVSAPAVNGWSGGGTFMYIVVVS